MVETNYGVHRSDPEGGKDMSSILLSSVLQY